MKLKEFFKPSLRKIILAVVLFLVIGFFAGLGIADVSLYGLPLVYYEGGHMPCPPDAVNCSRNTTIFFENLIIDIIFWYLIACLIVYFHRKR